MKSWQRAIACIMLIVFLPVSVLAGTFVSHCVGSDGHSALEFVLPGAHHADHDRAPADGAPATQDLAVDRLETSADCSDTPLMTASRLTQCAELIPISTLLDVSAFLIAFRHTLCRKTTDATAASLFTEPRSVLDPRFAELRTIVLLI